MMLPVDFRLSCKLKSEINFALFLFSLFPPISVVGFFFSCQRASSKERALFNVIKALNIQLKKNCCHQLYKSARKREQIMRIKRLMHTENGAMCYLLWFQWNITCFDVLYMHLVQLVESDKL